jgi:hypothetical protein
MVVNGLLMYNIIVFFKHFGTTAVFKIKIQKKCSLLGFGCYKSQKGKICMKKCEICKKNIYLFIKS